MISRMCLSLGLKTLSASCGNNKILKGTHIFKEDRGTKAYALHRCRGTSYCISPSAKENWNVRALLDFYICIYCSRLWGLFRIASSITAPPDEKLADTLLYIFSNLDQLKVTFRIDLVHCWPFELRRSEHCNVLYILLVRPHLPPPSPHPPIAPSPHPNQAHIPPNPVHGVPTIPQTLTRNPQPVFSPPQGFALVRTSQENTKRRNDISSESPDPEEKEHQKRKAYYPEKEKSDESLQDSDSSDPLTPGQSQGILQLTSPDKQEKIFEESEESKSLSSRRRRKLQRSQVQVMLQREKDNKEKLKDMTTDEKSEIEEKVAVALDENYDKHDLVARAHSGDITEESEDEAMEEDEAVMVDAEKVDTEVSNLEQAWQMFDLSKVGSFI